VASRKGPIAAVPVARMTFGASATSSLTCLRISRGSPPPHRVSIRTLRPSAQPHCFNTCRKAARLVCYKGRYNVRRLIEKYGRNANMMRWKEQLNGDCPKRDPDAI